MTQINNFNKYILIILFLLLSLRVAYPQTSTGINIAIGSLSIENYTNSINNLHKRFLAVNAHSILLSTTPSTANLVKFPHFSIGAQGGVAINNINNIRKIATELNQTINLKNNNLFEPLPLLGWGFIPTLRFGGGGIPFDVGIHLTYMPIEFYNGLRASKLSLGMDFRYAIVKDKNKNPGVSIGIKYVYDNTHVQWSSDNLSFKTQNSKNEEIFIFANRNKMIFDYSSHVISFPFQISKLIVSFEPYIGLEPFITFGHLSLNFETSPKVEHDNRLTDIQKYVRKIAKIKFNESLKVDDKGLRYNKTTVNGGVRLFAGFAFKLWLFYVDTQFSYEPINAELGGSLGFRLQY